LNQYVALLRGINVGGKNLIKMTDLATCFQALGFLFVRTYIQSGDPRSIPSRGCTNGKELLKITGADQLSVTVIVDLEQFSRW
jgi:hypothetical protein